MSKNLVIIVADTLRHLTRFPDLPLLESMPFLASIQSRAVRFDKLLASSNWTVPSHISLLTGSDPWSVNIEPSSSFYTVPASRSIAHEWNEGGGGTGIFSANPSVSPSNGTARGYAECFPRGLDLVGRWLSERSTTMNERLLERQTGSDIQPRPDSRPGPLASSLEFTGYGFHRLFRRFTDGGLVLRDLNRALRNQLIARPSHLLLNLMETHEPYWPADTPYSGQLDGAFFPTSNLSNFHTLLDSQPESKATLHEAYRRAASVLDSRLSAAFAILAKWDLLLDSSVLLVSDHGQCLGENGFYGHGHELFDEIVHVPAFLWDKDLPPVLTSAEWNSEWIDHRHLRDLILGVASASPPIGTETLFRESLERRGPATSYWEGGYARGTPFSRHATPMRRAVRIVQGVEDVSVWLEVSATGQLGSPRFDRDEARDEPLTPKAMSILHRRSASGGGREPTADPVDVDERLKSWGYG